MRAATLSIDVRAGEVDGNLTAALAGLRAAADERAALAVLPEMWPTSFTSEADDGELRASHAAVDAVAAEGHRLGVAVIGSAYGPRGGARELPSNRAHVLAQGALAGFHDKVHLFTPTAEHLAFRAGSAPPPVLEVAADEERVRLAPMVCYDLRFPDVARIAFREGAELLGVSAQWPKVRGPHWRALLAGRAAELCGFVVGCNRAGRDVVGRRRMELQFDRGMSGAYAPDGRRLDPSREAELEPEGEGRAPTSLALFELDLEEIQELRRAVPVHADEQVGAVAAWWAARGASEDRSRG
ncbi:MAG: nitrilase-related carbon-nitrogen hydrolase [Planctomycetota bacterium]|nr:nitrilase-related carbon-nitrogen hydrolase [Planctomycetota bacterium]